MGFLFRSRTTEMTDNSTPEHVYRVVCVWDYATGTLIRYRSNTCRPRSTNTAGIIELKRLAAGGSSTNNRGAKISNDVPGLRFSLPR